MRICFFISGLYLMLLTIFIAPVGAEEIVDTSASYTKVSNSESAIMLAHEFTGFDMLEGYSKANVTAQRVIPDPMEFPYVAGIIGKSEVWEIIYRSVKTGRGSHSANRDFSVIIDNDGRLLSIYSVSDDAGSSDTLPQIDYERFFNMSGYSSASLIDSVPASDFNRVLRGIPKNPARAKVIRGFYFCSSPDTSQCKNSWIVLLQGATPMLMGHKGGAIPVNQRNYFYIMSNPNTGRCLGYGNIGGWR